MSERSTPNVSICFGYSVIDKARLSRLFDVDYQMEL